MKLSVLKKFPKCPARYKKLKTRAKKCGFKKLLPIAYFAFLMLGVLLTFLYSFIHSLTTCSSLFGTDFCTPTGIFIALLASLPGYMISGNLLEFIGELPWGLSFAIVMGTSFVFYYLLGMFIDNFRAKKMDSENLSRILIIAFFAILLILLIGLL